jgi:tripartite-type tricarboxylate transporter receptor subunit TctC
MPSLDDMSSWIAFVAPAGTPRPIIDKLNAEVAKIYADPASADKLEKAGITAVASSPEEFDAFVRNEYVRWDKALKESGITLD